MSWSEFLEPYGFEYQNPTLRGVGTEHTRLWRRGELRLLFNQRPFRIFVDEGGLEILFKESYDAPYQPLTEVLDRTGIDWQRDADAQTLLGRHIDVILIYFDYKFLFDHEFELVSHGDRGGGRSTLVLRRRDLELHLDFDGDAERIDFNGVPLAEILRVNGIEGSGLADLRANLDVVLASFVTATSSPI